MAFDLVVGKTPLVRDQPTIVGALDHAELPALGALHKRSASWVFAEFMNLYQDQRWDPERLADGRAQLLALLPEPLAEPERALVHKLIAVMTYALERGLPLFGVAD